MERHSRRSQATYFAVMALLALSYVLYVVATTHSFPSFWGDDRYNVKAVTPTAASLVPGARVTSAGVTVGRVTGIRRQGVGAVVSMEFDDNTVIPLPRDTTMRVRQRTPVGENYVEIMPGTSREDVESGTVLPLRQPDDYVELDQVLSILQGPTRERARELLQGLGGALDGRGPELNDLLGGASATLDPLTVVADVGGAQRGKIKSLIAATGRIMGAIGERQGAVEQVARNGLTTVNALAARDRELSALLRVLPSTLSQVRGTAKTLGDTTEKATPVLASLATAVRDLEPTVTTLRPAAEGGRDVVRELGAVITPLTGTLDRLRSLSPSTVKALPKLKQTLCEADPMLRYIGRYKDDLASGLANMGSSVNSYDSLGHMARVSVVTGENQIAGLPGELSESLASLFHTGALSELQGLTLDPYPQPGQIGKTGLPAKRYLTTEALGKSDYPFERVQAEC